MKLLPRPGAHRRRRLRSRLGRRPPSLARPSLHRLSFPRPTLPRPSLPRAPWTLLKLPRPTLARATSSRRRQAGPPPVERRRARALLFLAAVFAAIVLLSGLPWSTILNQKAQLSSATVEVKELQAENNALAVQAQQLAANSTQAALARQDYGLVHPGQTAYDVLPPPGPAASAAIGGGHVPLDETAVVPGSRRSEELLGAGVVGSTPAAAASGQVRTEAGATADGGVSGAHGVSGGFWSRVVRTLEFWS